MKKITCPQCKGLPSGATEEARMSSSDINIKTVDILNLVRWILQCVTNFLLVFISIIFFLRKCMVGNNQMLSCLWKNLSFQKSANAIIFTYKYCPNKYKFKDLQIPNVQVSDFYFTWCVPNSIHTIIGTGRHISTSQFLRRSNWTSG